MDSSETMTARVARRIRLGQLDEHHIDAEHPEVSGGFLYSLVLWETGFVDSASDLISLCKRVPFNPLKTVARLCNVRASIVSVLLYQPV